MGYPVMMGYVRKYGEKYRIQIQILVKSLNFGNKKRTSYSPTPVGSVYLSDSYAINLVGHY